MPGYLDSASNIEFGWVVGEDGWGAAMNRSLRQLAYVGGTRSIKNRTTSTPPSNPTAGDKYIVAANPTGLWSSYNAGDIAVWGRGLITPATLAWQRFRPQRSLILYDEGADQIIKYNGTAWGPPTASLPTAQKPVWAQTADVALSGSLTAGTPSLVMALGDVDLNPVGRQLVASAKYGAYVEATASTASGALPVDAITTFTTSAPGSFSSPNAVRTTSAGYDLGLGFMVAVPPANASHFGIYVSFSSATGGPFNLTLKYIGGPRLI